MAIYEKFSVKDSEEFCSDNYPQVLQDLNQIIEETANVPHASRADILISFAKNHSLENEWIKDNPEFVRMVTTGALPTKRIEALFEASNRNTFFQQQFTSFLKSNFNE